MAHTHAHDVAKPTRRAVAKSITREPKPKKSRPTLAERHAAKVDTSGGENACWPWTASFVPTTGYGQIRSTSRITGKSSMRAAHMVAWELANGRELPEGMLVRHTCHNPKCQNPAHLVEGYPIDNAADMIAAGRQRKKRMKRDTIIAIARAGIFKKMSPVDIAAKYECCPSTARSILRGITNTKITGIPRNVATNQGRDFEALREAMTKHGTAPSQRKRSKPVQLEMFAGA